MKTPKQIIDCIDKAMNQSEMVNFYPNTIIMHGSLYNLLSKEYHLFNKYCGLDVQIDNDAPKDNFYLIKTENNENTNATNQRSN